MNRIYKVIWSKVKHQYVVVSELAHSNGKQNSKSEHGVVQGALRGLAAALMVAGSLLVMPYTASAAENVVSYENSVEDGNYWIDTNGNRLTFIEAERATSGVYTIDINGEETTVPVEDLYNINGQYGVFVEQDKTDYTVNDIYTGAVTDNQQNEILPKGQHIVYNQDGFYASNGKGSYNSLNKDGLWVGSEGDSTTGFHVDNDGNIITTGDAKIEGKVTAATLQNANETFKADENGNVTATSVETKKLDVNGDLQADSGTIGGVRLEGDKVTAGSLSAGALTADEAGAKVNGDLQANSGTIGGVRLEGDKVTAGSLSAGALTADEAGAKVNGDLQANSGTIGGVRLEGDKVTAGSLSAGALTADEAGAKVNGDLQASSGTIGGVRLEGDKVTAGSLSAGVLTVDATGAKVNGDLQANSGTIGGVRLSGDTVTATSVTGLSNTTWDGTTNDKSRAATEGQLSEVQGYVDNLENKTIHIEHKTEQDGTDYTLVEETKFYANGNVNVKNALTVGGQTTINANADIKGTLEVAGNKFKVNDNGDITTTGELSVGSGKFTVKTNGDTEVGGTLTVQGYTTVNADAKITGNLTAATLQNANETFKADENGNVTATSVTGLNNTQWNADNVIESQAATEGQLADVDAKVNQNAADLAEYKAAGIIAGDTGNYESRSVSIGESSQATGYNSVAVGTESHAYGTQSVALGGNATVNANTKNAVALGAGSVADRNSSVSVGSKDAKRQITNVAAGTEDTDAANVGQLNEKTAGMVKWDSETVDGETIYNEGTIKGVTLNNSTVTAANGGTFGNVKLSANAITGANGENVSINGITASEYSASTTTRTTDQAKDKDIILSNSESDSVNVSSLDRVTTDVADRTQKISYDSEKGITKIGDKYGVEFSNNGAISAAKGNFKVADNGNVTLKGDIDVKDSKDNTTVKVEAATGKITTEGTMYVNGNEEVATENYVNTATENMVEWDADTNNTIHGVTLNGGTITAGNGAFNVYATGGMKALYGKFAGSITAADEKFKVDGNGGITGQSLDVNKGTIKAANGKFNVYTSGGMTAASGKFGGGITAAGEKFKVDGNGNITTKEITAADGKFHVWGSTGGISAADGKFTVNGYNGDVTMGNVTVTNNTITGLTAVTNDNTAAATVGQLNEVKTSVGDVNTTLNNYEKAGMVAGTIVGNKDEDSIVIGERAKLWGSNENSIAIGGHIFSARDESISIGINSMIHGTGSIAIGNSSWIGSDADNSIAFGYNAKVNNPAQNAVAIGANSIATESNVVSVGDKDKNLQRRIVNVADGTGEYDAVNVGQMNTIIFGDRSGSDSISGKLINGAKSIIGGINKNSDAIQTIVQNELGKNVKWNEYAEDIQTATTQIAKFSAMANNINWDALAKIAPMSAEPIATPVAPEGSPNPSTGSEGSPNPSGGGWTGTSGKTTTTDDVEIGGSLKVEGEATFNNKATFNDNVDINGELDMNGNKITGVAAGTETMDAVNYGQLREVQTQVDDLGTRMSNVENRLGDVEERIDKVGAMAAAIANLRTMGYDPEAPTEIAVGVGQYKSETGLALGIFHYPNQDFMLSASISTSGDEVMGGIGATWKLGRKSAEERAKDEEERILAKAEEIKQAAKRAEVKAQADRHAQLLAEREAAGEPIRPVEEA